MKNVLKYFAFGVILTFIFTIASSVCADGKKRTIEVYFNLANFKVNGKPVVADSINYNGKNYLPIRDIAEMLGKDVIWDAKNNTVCIDDKIEDILRPNNPTGVKLSVDQNKRVFVSWDKNSEVDYFYVYCSTNNIFFSVIVNEEGLPKKYKWFSDDYSAIISGVPANTVIYVKVTAVKNGIESKYSNTVSILVP